MKISPNCDGAIPLVIAVGAGAGAHIGLGAKDEADPSPLPTAYCLLPTAIDDTESPSTAIRITPKEPSALTMLYDLPTPKECVAQLLSVARTWMGKTLVHDLRAT
jgi:hypothetical protein